MGGAAHARFATALEGVPPNSELHVHFENLAYIDHACLDLLMSWEKQHVNTGGRLVIDWESLTAKFHETPQAAAANNGSGSQLDEQGIDGEKAPRPTFSATD